MTAKPIIGISLDYLHDDESNKYSSYPWYALRQQYSDVISKCGAIPIFLPFESYSNNLDEIIALIDGALIPGGDFNIPANLYGQTQAFSGRAAIERAENEAKLIKKALEIDMPILGICHGMQLLNVILGGSLFQNIGKQIGTKITHKNKMRDKTIHRIAIDPSSKLYNIFECKEASVNSNHSQSIDRIGDGLIVSAYCPEDGVVEAIESQAHSFVIGVEWHPEICASPEIDMRLFEAFIKSAKEYAAKTI